jgi:aerobic-type carbon monoxide dehydrogenase small subunit (CoxS/CutS family)
MPMDGPIQITLNVNDRRHTVTTPPRRSLLEVLREELQITGLKYGCGEGTCGSCAVLIDGQCTRSCVTPVADAKDKSITTIEGLAKGEELHPVQEAFLAENAFQCGYCTPGMILETVSLLNRKPTPRDADLRGALDSHICRCCAYPAILQAMRQAAKVQGEERDAS